MTLREAVLFLGLGLFACADSHQLIRTQGTSAPRIEAADSFYVATAADGAYGAQRYAGSGQSTSTMIGLALQEHSRAVRVARDNQSFDDAIASAKGLGSRYLVYATILHWEDRATEWSGISDKVEVKIEVIDPTSGETLTTGIVKGKSGLATLGGDHPQDLLPEPITEFVGALYQ
jgi:hypothetical protein